MKEAVIVFTRIPIPGQTKTRMRPYLSPTECAEIHKCFLRDIAAECQKTGKDIFVFYTPQGKQQSLFPIFGIQAVYREQRGGDLGQRMYLAISDVLAAGYESCVLFGTDIPEIKAEDLDLAFGKLKNCDVVFGPSGDGGYYLVGMKKPRQEVFSEKNYGHGSVLADAVAGLRECGIRIGYLRQLDDMDRPGDLQRLYLRLKRQKKLGCSHTGRFLLRHLKISVIIPIYNEEKKIQSIQRQLADLRNKCEIIFTDGGSTDQTLAKIGPGFKVIQVPKGRAQQMNAGARESSGDILFFLHCDSRLPAAALTQIRRVMINYQVGGFGIAFQSRNFFMMTNRIISNHRMKYRGIIFGDQGMFIDRKLFFDLGGFPDLPIMEDYQFSLNLRQKGIKIGMTRRRIYTSDRRYPQGTIPKLRVMWRMAMLRRMYRRKVPAEQIARLYKDIR